MNFGRDSTIDWIDDDAVNHSKIEALSNFLETLGPGLSGQLDAVVKARNDEECEDGRSDGAANDGYGHRPVKLATFSNANGHRHHACNQSKSCHDDGAQSLASCGHECFFAFNAVRL